MVLNVVVILFLIKFYVDRKIVMIMVISEELNVKCIKEIFIGFKTYNSRNKIFFLKEFIILMYMAFDWYKLWKGNKRH